MKDKDNITLLPGGASPNAMKEALRNLKEVQGEMIEYQAIQAKLHREKYDALILEGFTSEQALELCKVLF